MQIGFVCVLFIGNYYRAKKASEKQKQRRIARLFSNGGTATANGVLVDSPKSKSSSTSGSSALHNDDTMETERQHLLKKPSQQQQQQRRRNHNHNNNHQNLMHHQMLDETESLLFQVTDRYVTGMLLGF